MGTTQYDILVLALETIADISDVGLLFDGADHLNEYTHEANEKHVAAALDRINDIARSVLRGEAWE